MEVISDTDGSFEVITLSNSQADSSCAIMSLILMTTLFYKALILQGEIWCWSLLGLKGLKRIKPAFFMIRVLETPQSS